MTSLKGEISQQMPIRGNVAHGSNRMQIAQESQELAGSTLFFLAQSLTCTRGSGTNGKEDKEAHIKGLAHAGKPWR